MDDPEVHAAAVDLILHASQLRRYAADVVEAGGTGLELLRRAVRVEARAAALVHEPGEVLTSAGCRCDRCTAGTVRRTVVEALGDPGLPHPHCLRPPCRCRLVPKGYLVP